MVLLLNQANKIIHEEILSEGGITGTVADPRIIFKLALSHQATGFIICHNHPSGQLIPSRMDDVLTEKIKKGAAYFDIKLIICEYIMMGFCLFLYSYSKLPY